MGGLTEGAAARTSTSRELPTGEPSRKLDEMALGGVKLQKKTHTTYEQKQNKIQARVPFFGVVRGRGQQKEQVKMNK